MTTLFLWKGLIDYNRGQLWFDRKKLQEKVSQGFIVVSGVLNNISKAYQNPITGNVKISRWPPPVFFLTDLKKIILSDLIVQLYDRNKICQKCYFKQH